MWYDNLNIDDLSEYTSLMLKELEANSKCKKNNKLDTQRDSQIKK